MGCCYPRGFHIKPLSPLKDVYDLLSSSHLRHPKGALVSPKNPEESGSHLSPHTNLPYKVVPWLSGPSMTSSLGGEARQHESWGQAGAGWRRVGGGLRGPARLMAESGLIIHQLSRSKAEGIAHLVLPGCLHPTARIPGESICAVKVTSEISNNWKCHGCLPHPTQELGAGRGEDQGNTLRQRAVGP